MLPDCSKFPTRNVQTHGYVFHDTNGQNRGRKWRSRGTSWTKFVWTPICWSLVGKTVRGRSVGTWMVKKYRIGKVSLVTEIKDYSYRYTWMASKLLERSRMWLPCGRHAWKMLILTNQLHFLITCTWDALGVNANRTKLLLSTEFAPRISAAATEKLPGWEKTSRKDGCVVLRHGRTCSKMRWEILRSGEQIRPSSHAKSQVLAWMIANSRRSNLNQLENCQKYAHKLSWNACTWQELVDMTFSDNADWDCFKTLISGEILKIRNPLLEEHYAFSEVEHSFPLVGCARNKSQYPTVLQNQKSFRWLLVCEWMDYLLLILWNVVIENPTRRHVNQRKLHTWCAGPSPYFSMFSCSHFLLYRKQKAECHVQESSGKYFQRRFGSGETETNEFGVKEPPEREEKSSARFERFEQPEESRIGSEMCLIERQETDAKYQPKPNNVFSRGNKMTLNLPAPGNWGGEMKFQAQPAPRNWSEVMMSKSDWYGDYSCRHRWKPPFILDQITLKNWKDRGTQTSRNFRIYAITRRNWFLDHQAEFWMWHRLIGQLPRWRDLHLLTTKWSCGQKQEYASAKIPSYFWKNVRSFESESKMWKSSWRILTVQFSQRITWNWWRTDSVRVEYFPRTHFIGDPPKDPERPARSKHWTWRFWRPNHVQWQCSMTKRGNSEKCFPMSEKVRKYAKRFSRGHWAFLGCTPEGKWDSIATQMVERFKETGHPVFKSISAWSREILISENNRDAIHFTSRRMLRTQNSLFAQFTQQISSVSTEQSQAGVKSSVKGRMRKSRLRKGSWGNKMSSCCRMCNRKK